MPAEDPTKDNIIWNTFCQKEIDFHLKHSVGHLDDGPLQYRVPMQGELIKVVGLRNRPELNGRRGEILNGSADKDGRVTVRLFNCVQAGRNGDARDMRICPSRLVPLVGALGASTSSPAIEQRAGGSAPAGSTSRAASRALSSAMSGSCRSGRSKSASGSRRSKSASVTSLPKI
mmetsp:Transcript_82312/g.143026  ORF Transcript_82312/g.143026 Transcript_82312/m.143026 type:complete len:174 (+) Transcript_82312:87-608(+)